MNSSNNKSKYKKPANGRAIKGRGTGPNRGGQGRKNKKSQLNPKLLISKPTDEPAENYKADILFTELPIHDTLQKNLEKKGYTHPTKIQEQTYKHLIDGKNLIGIANTGTGKTGSFLIPIIDQLLKDDRQQSLIVVPTRELALQVEKEFKSLTHSMKLWSACFIGGTSLAKDFKTLQRNHHVIIGTPGRLMDLVDRKVLNFNKVTNLVLDEFDRMLDMGFVNDVRKIVGLIKNRKQTMLFSATMDKTQDSIIRQLVKDPVLIKVNSGSSTADKIEQDIIEVPNGNDKFEMLLNLIGGEDFKKVLLFIETKRLVEKVSKRLKKSGVRTEVIHGNKSQNYRNNALNKFKVGNIQVLVATDVAARGIDVTNVTHVINYQVPQTFDNYIHRIGRTGRAGNAGKAFTFVD